MPVGFDPKSKLLKIGSLPFWGHLHGDWEGGKAKERDAALLDLNVAFKFRLAIAYRTAFAGKFLPRFGGNAMAQPVTRSFRKS